MPTANKGAHAYGGAWRTASIGVLLSIVVALSLADAQDSAERTDLDHAIRDAVGKWSAETHTFVNESLIAEMVNSSNQFRIVYCYPSNTQKVRDGCGSLLRSPERLKAIAGNFLDQFRQESRFVTTFYALLATGIGSSSQESGWAPIEVRRFWTLEIPPKQQGAVFDVRSSPVSLGSPVRLILSAGSFAFLVKQIGMSEVSIRASWTSSDAVPKVTYEAVRTEDPGREGLVDSPILIDPVIKNYCQDWVNVSADPSRRPKGRDEVRQGTFAPFSQAQALELVVSSDTELCGRDCERLLAAFFVQAISLWRSGCQDCDPWLVSAIRFKDDVYVDGQLVDALAISKAQKRTLAELLTSSKQNPANPVQDTSVLSRPYFGNTSRAISGYHNVSKDASIRGDFCREALPLPLKQIICSSGECPGCLSIRLDVYGHATSCGTSERIIACASPTRGVQLNASAFRFSGLVPTVSRAE